MLNFAAGITGDHRALARLRMIRNRGDNSGVLVKGVNHSPLHQVPEDNLAHDLAAGVGFKGERTTRAGK